MTIENDAATNAAADPAPAGKAPQVTESAPVGNDPAAAAKPDGFSQRIDELTRIRRDEERARQAAERDRDHWREMALRNQRQPEPAKEPETSIKTLADFEYDESKYQSYLFQQTEQRAVAAAERRLKEQDEQVSRQRRQSTFQQRMSSFEKDAPDFREKVFSNANPVSDAMRDVIEASEEGPAVAYYLANNLSLADSIARMPPLDAAREMGRIEAKLIADREKAAKKVSDAPPPPPTLEGADPKVEKAPKEMSDSEFAKWRKKFISARR